MDENLNLNPEHDAQALAEIDEMLLDILAVFVVSVGLLCACLLIAASR